MLVNKSWNEEISYNQSIFRYLLSKNNSNKNSHAYATLVEKRLTENEDLIKKLGKIGHIKRRKLGDPSVRRLRVANQKKKLEQAKNTAILEGSLQKPKSKKKDKGWKVFFCSYKFADTLRERRVCYMFQY